MTMADPWLPKELWDKAVIAPWKLRLLRLVFPRREIVVIRGHTYVIRTPHE